MPSQKNIEILKKSTEILKQGKALYFTDFTGMTVQQIEQLRRELKKNQCNYLVIKNKIGILALKNLGYEIEPAQKIFFGPIGIAIAYDDPLVPTKILKDIKGLKIKGAFIEGSLFDANGVAEIAKIPSKTVLLRSVLISLNLLGNLVNTLNTVIGNFINTIEGIKNKNQ